MYRERENDEREEQIREERAHKFCSEGGVVRSPQRRALWRGVESFKEGFAELPGRARNYECELKIREHAPYVQRSYLVPFSKRKFRKS